MQFGERLWYLRKKKGLGLKALSKTVRVHHSYLSRIEAGHVRPSEQVISKLAKTLGHDEAELMILADRVPPRWRRMIKMAPDETTSLIRESLEDYGKETVSKHNHNSGEKSTRLALEAGISARPKRKSPEGVSTNDLVFSAHLGTNDEVFPKILSLYVAPGSTVADVTYGKGVFWKQVPKTLYRVLATDVHSGVDCRSLPYEDASVDSVVLDPPYMHTPGGTAHVGHQNYESYYRNNSAGNGSDKKYHEAVLDLYFAAGSEAWRILKREGIFIVKCADEVCANQQRLTHVELINEYTKKGFVVEDVFVLFRQNRPGVSRIIKQVHARKNHSYFLVFRKSSGKSRWFGPRVSSTAG